MKELNVVEILSGTVVAMHRGSCSVKLDAGPTILATIAGKLMRYRIGNRYWGRLDADSRKLVFDVLRQHPGLTLAEALSHLWWCGGV